MTSPFLAERRALYFVHARGCGACEEAAPELDLFEHSRPNLMVIRLDASLGFAQRLGIDVKLTPTYVYRVGDQGLRHEGALTAKELAVWLDSAEKRFADGDTAEDDPEPEQDEGEEEEASP